MPQRSINAPANTKDGIASNTQLCDAPRIVEATVCKG